jgi:non-ribosomal peptide synthetase component F
MLEILQAGCFYVPLDTSLPVARTAAMMSESEPTLSVYHAATATLVRGLSAESEVLFQQLHVDDTPLKDPAFETPRALDPNAAAILLFTSGSTGRPKGVMLSKAESI